MLPYAALLRQELSARNQEYARRHRLPHACSFGMPPVVCFEPYEENRRHGNFLPRTYAAILANPNWRWRLQKAHSQARTALPRNPRERWCELDSSCSSDALLMNVFCYPGILRDRRLRMVLGIDGDATPEFGVKARVPLANGKFDRTEVDMRLGSLVVEAKLTESDFQSCAIATAESYRDFAEVFERGRLPRSSGRYLSYQLIRNVLAANASVYAFCVLFDERRPDLREAWFAIMSCVRLHELRLRCKAMTWQELAAVLPRRLQGFLEEKYGIVSDRERLKHSTP